MHKMITTLGSLGLAAVLLNAGEENPDKENDRQRSHDGPSRSVGTDRDWKRDGDNYSRESGNVPDRERGTIQNSRDSKD